MKVYELLLVVVLCGVIECKRKSKSVKSHDDVTEHVIEKNKLFKTVMTEELLEKFKENINVTLISKDETLDFVKKFLAVTLTLSPHDIRNAVAKIADFLNKADDKDKPLLQSIRKEVTRFNKSEEDDQFDVIFKVWYFFNNVKNNTDLLKELETMFELKHPTNIDDKLNSILSGRRSKLSRLFKDIVKDVNFLRKKNKSDNVLAALKSAVYSLTSARRQALKSRNGRENRHLLTDFVIDLCNLANEVPGGVMLSVLQAIDVGLLDFTYPGSAMNALLESAPERTSYYNTVNSLGSTLSEISDNIQKFKNNLMRVNNDADYKPVVDFLSVFDNYLGDNRNYPEDTQMYMNTIFKDVTNLIDARSQGLDAPVSEFIKEIIFKPLNRIGPDDMNKLAELITEISTQVQ